MKKVLAAMPPAAHASVGRNSFAGFCAALERQHTLVCVGTGNSVAPACYLDWLLCQSTEHQSRVMTPLEYLLEPPRRPHVCVVFSQQARHRDVRAVIEASEQRKSPVFLVCASEALEKSEVVGNVARRHGPEHVLTFETGKENSFINVVGTAAAFAAAHELAASLSNDLPKLTEVTQCDKILARGPVVDSWVSPLAVLRGPAGVAPAKALISYLSETTGPLVKEQCVKDFTHGSFRGADQAGADRFLMLADRATGPLFDHVQGFLAPRHSCVRLQCDSAHWSVEPFDLLILATRVFMELAEQYRKVAGPNWTPLHADKTLAQRYRGLVSGFDIASLLHSENRNGTESG